MALELLPVNRRPVVYFTGAINAGADVPAALGGAAGTYLINRAAGNARVLGLVVDAQAPAAGFPRIRFWASPSAATPLATYGPGSGFVTADPNNANTFMIDCPLLTPYFTIELTQGAVGGTVTIVAWVLPEGGSVASGGGSAPVNPASLPATYRVAFDGIIFASAGGQFLELRNPAASGRVLRASFQMFVKPSVNVQFQIRKQSALSTGGVATTPTPVPLDSNNAATVGVVKLYTTAPANGASPGNLYDAPVWPGDTFIDPPNASQSPYSQLVTLRPGESVGWQSDVAFTADGVLEFTDAAS